MSRSMSDQTLSVQNPASNNLNIEVNTVSPSDTSESELETFLPLPSDTRRASDSGLSDNNQSDLFMTTTNRRFFSVGHVDEPLVDTKKKPETDEQNFEEVEGSARRREELKRLLRLKKTKDNFFKKPTDSGESTETARRTSLSKSILKVTETTSPSKKTKNIRKKKADPSDDESILLSKTIDLEHDTQNFGLTHESSLQGPPNSQSMAIAAHDLIKTQQQLTEAHLTMHQVNIELNCLTSQKKLLMAHLEKTSHSLNKMITLKQQLLTKQKEHELRLKNARLLWQNMQALERAKTTDILRRKTELLTTSIKALEIQKQANQTDSILNEATKEHSVPELEADSDEVQQKTRQIGSSEDDSSESDGSSMQSEIEEYIPLMGSAENIEQPGFSILSENSKTESQEPSKIISQLLPSELNSTKTKKAKNGSTRKSPRLFTGDKPVSKKSRKSINGEKVTATTALKKVKRKKSSKLKPGSI